MTTYRRTCRHCGGICETYQRDDPCTLCFGNPLDHGPMIGVWWGLILLTTFVLATGGLIFWLVAP